MNDFLSTTNAVPVSLEALEPHSLPEFRRRVLFLCAAGSRPLLLFAAPDGQGGRFLVAALAEDAQHTIQVLRSAPFAPDDSYPSLTGDEQRFHMLERELFEDEGLRPEGHPWLKPVRRTTGYDFFQMEGDGIHEVAVGPVHAGVIEPGHFRFQCSGEEVHHLEISLGYQHRGVEALMQQGLATRGPRRLHQLAESIAGDSVAAHTCAHAAVLEGLGGVQITPRHAALRLLALELERAAMHAADLAALAGDVAFLFGNAVYGANRTLIINSMLELCGSRFTRGLIRVGGCAWDCSPQVAASMIANLKKAAQDTDLVGKVMFAAASVNSRFERTGTVTRQQAHDAGLTGLAARASGLPLDVRGSHPLWGYQDLPLKAFGEETGDVAARANLRRYELADSLAACIHILEGFQSVQAAHAVSGSGVGSGAVQAAHAVSGSGVGSGAVQAAHAVSGSVALSPLSFNVSLVEGWRGEVCHAAVTGPDGQVLRYKIKDPSLNNWFGLALAVRDNGISDFPLCNKSFDLSYCGTDL
jgi:Ni,Fe-hydrogenase III large subunit